MTRKILLIQLLLMLCSTAWAQHTMQGKIEYARSTNLKRVIDEMDEDNKRWINKMGNKIPSHNTLYFDLLFTNTQSIYKPGRESEESVNMWFARSPASENIVFTDLQTGKVTAQKQIYEEKFLIKDTMRKLKWKISDEVRTIANYKCRKAVTIMHDSVYVVAFYTEDIPASTGPEMFSGLPGMILQIAIPRLHTTWVAQKIEYQKPEEKELTPPKKGKEVTQKEMYTTISTSLERWGKYADKAVWWSFL